MPLFEFKCGSCGAVCEQLMRLSPARPDPCPKCGSRKLEKQLSTFSASVRDDSGFACPSGSCPTEGCATGACPFSKS